MTEWEWADPAIPLIAARCAHCYQLVARYCAPRSNGPGSWESGRNGCTCDPAPVLPEGDELDRLVTRARRASKGFDVDAPVKIRVRRALR